MSEKEEIIIDGVDVSECSLSLYDHYDNSICLGFDGGYNVFCSDNPDCYYKQLKRTKAQYNKVVEQNKSLQTALQELQEALERADEDIKAECTRCSTTISLDDELEELKVQNEKLVKDNNVLNKTLKEIAEIAKTKIYTPACFEDPDCPKNGGVGFDNNCDEYCPLITIERILEKIKEVENE